MRRIAAAMNSNASILPSSRMSSGSFGISSRMSTGMRWDASAGEGTAAAGDAQNDDNESMSGSTMYHVSAVGNALMGGDGMGVSAITFEQHLNMVR